MTTRLDALPPDADDHARLMTQTAVLAVVSALRQTGTETEFEEVLGRFPVLSEHLDAAMRHVADGTTWSELRREWRPTVEAWERSVDAPALRLQAAGLVDFAGRAALALAGLVDHDSRFGAVMEQLQAPLPGRRPTVHTIAAALRFVGEGDGVAVCQRLVDRGIVEETEGAQILGDRRLRVPDAVRAALVPGAPIRWPDGWETLDMAVAPELCLPTATVDEVGRAADALASGRLDTVVIRGTNGSDRLLAAEEVARRLGRGVVGSTADEPSLIVPPTVAVVAAARSMCPVIEFDPRPGQRIVLPGSGLVPTIAVLGPDGGLEPHRRGRAAIVDIPRLDPALRRRRWATALSRLPLADADIVVERFQLPGRLIGSVAAGAEAVAVVEGAGAVSVDHVRRAVGDEAERLLGPLATRLDPVAGWHRLVVGDDIAAELRGLELRCRYRERLATATAAASGGRPRPGEGSIGVRALLSGPSGTGKTLAARTLGAELGIDVYRVDLSAIFDKYVGETEKNLHRILSAAEQLDIVLLIDEGDSLFGGRTEVRSANDRYANLETNYLLQRIEGYEGIVVVTTNARGSIDTAFARRMDVSIAFRPPTATERHGIWRGHLGDDHAVPDTWLERLAVEHELTGGQIRNAALHAALLALDDNDGRIERTHVEAATLVEYRKSGAMAPGSRPAADSVAAKLSALMESV